MSGYPLQIYDSKIQNIVSYKLPSGDDYNFYRYISSIDKFIAVKNFGDVYQEVIIFDGREEVTVKKFENVGIYYPLLNRNKELSFFANKNRLDLPPKSDQTSSLFVTHPDEAEKNRDVSSLLCIKENLPLIPYDYSEYTKAYYYTVVDDGKYYIEQKATVDEKGNRLFEGIFPRISHRGDIIAYISGKKVFVYDLIKSKNITSINIGKDMSWLSWSPDDKRLVISVVSSVYKNDVIIFDIEHNITKKIFSTGILKDLNWISVMPELKMYEK